MGRKSPGETGEDGRGEEGAETVAGHVDAHHLGRGFVGAHGFHGATDMGPPDDPQNEKSQDQQAIDRDDAGAFGDAGETKGAAEPFDVEIDGAQHFAEANGGDREVDAGEAQGGTADQQGKDDGDDAGGRQHEEEGQFEF